MKSKVVTFTDTELNTTSGVIKDCMIHIAPGSGLFTSRAFHMYPTMLRIDNTSGSDFEFILVYNLDEETDVANNPDNYGKLSVKDGDVFTLDPCPRSSGIIGEGDGTATADLNVWFGKYINYV